MPFRYEARHNGKLQELFSFAVAGNIVAAGAQGSLFFWDRRTQQALACYEDTHMDDVTQVRAAWSTCWRACRVWGGEAIVL